MRQDQVEAPFYVIKAKELSALVLMPADYPNPQGLVWIDRGRNTRLQSTNIQMLIRTLYRSIETPSIRRLHESSGLKVIFRTDEDRAKFAQMFRAAVSARNERCNRDCHSA
jgi:hypothetical protein